MHSHGRVFFFIRATPARQTSEQTGGCKNCKWKWGSGPTPKTKQNRGFYIIYLYGPPGTDANVLTTGVCAGRFIFHTALYAPVPFTLCKPKQLDCGTLNKTFFPSPAHLPLSFSNWTITEKWPCLRWIVILLSDQVFLLKEPSDYPLNAVERGGVGATDVFISHLPPERIRAVGLFGRDRSFMTAITI